MTKHTLYECGICDSLHRWDWDGDCREDAERFGDVGEYSERTGVKEFDSTGHLQIVVRSWEDRVEVDLGD